MSIHTGFLLFVLLLIGYLLSVRLARYVIHQHVLPARRAQEFKANVAAYFQRINTRSPPASVTGPPVAGDGGDTG